MDYCCHVYSNASSTNLKMLEVVQNQCIGLALGARQTSPIMSLEVEANIPPLSIRRKYLTLKYYNKILDCPVTSPACSLMVGSDANISKSSMTMVGKLYNELGINKIQHRDCATVTCIPPFESLLSEGICRDFAEGIANLSNGEIHEINENMVDMKYNNYMKFYTDGSKNDTDTAAAFVMEDQLQRQWRLNPKSSNNFAEMFAIYKVLVYIKENYQLNTGHFAILSDSLTSMILIRNRNPKASSVLVFEIHRLLYELKTNKTIKIQWIPAHRGILGNEAADTAAKAALSVNNSTITRMV